MPEVTRQCHVNVGAQQVWEAVSTVAAMLDWYPNANKAEKLEGPDEGVGRVQRVRYKIGRRNAAIDQEVVDWEPARRIEWRQVREFLGTKQTPLFAKDVMTAIEIDPDDDGSGCVLRFHSEWKPVGLKGQLATKTVIEPKIESLADAALDCIVHRCVDHD